MSFPVRSTRASRGSLGSNLISSRLETAPARVAIAICLTAATTPAMAQSLWEDVTPETMTELAGFGGTYAIAQDVSSDGSVIVGYATNGAGSGYGTSWTGVGTTANNLGSLGGNSSSAEAVSADGNVIVGYARNGAGQDHAAAWINGSTTAIDLGALGGNYSSAQAVNSDGSVIVGYAYLSPSLYHAAAWVGGSTTAIDLGTLGGNYSSAVAVSHDGNVIIGQAANGAGQTRAASWVGGSTTATDLGTLGGTYSYTRAVNADGSVIVGYARTAANESHAASWVNGSTTAIDLGTLGGPSSYAYDVSSDGSVIVGYAVTASGNQHAASWVNGSTTATDLGSLGGDVSLASAVSADGSVIVGYAGNGATETRAAAWFDGSTEATDLGSLGGTYGRAYAVSDDGSVIVGYSLKANGEGAPFIWRTEMQDFGNLMLSFPVLANDTEVAVAQQQFAAGRLMGQTGLAEAGQSFMSVSGSFANTGSTSAQGLGGRSTDAGTLTYGRGIDGGTTFGGTLTANATSLNSNGFDMSASFGASFWGEYSAGGLSHTGLQAGAAFGWTRESGSITRGRGLANVMLASGSAEIDTLSASAHIGYGFAHQDWLITPSATLAHYRTTRSAYSETGADFNASYDALTVDRTTLTLAVTGDYRLSEQGTLSLGVGVDHDLAADGVTLTGTSAVPGLANISTSSTLARHDTRGFLDVGYSHDFGNGHSLTGSVRVGQATFGDAPQVGVGISYGIRF